MATTEHSAAIMEDAGKTIATPAQHPAAEDGSSKAADYGASSTRQESGSNNFNRRKRKGDFLDASVRHGSRGKRDDGRGNKSRHQKSDMGRGEYFRDSPDKRSKTNASREKREEGRGPSYGTTFSKEEIDAEERKPKRKVAVLIGYSGTGYKGMQISASEKTIEGDLFDAFIAAGAISKANADDPKKASLVRCARTDKGVHAAGNMISLKLIVEDDQIVQKINDNLSPQIRVWGIERTIGSFSCYQACDSRWYEYLIPSHAFLPPHPSSWLAKKLEELAGKGEERTQFESRQEEVKGFWESVDEVEIKSILEDIDGDIRFDVIKALQGEDEANAKAATIDADMDQAVKVGKSFGGGIVEKIQDENTEEATIVINELPPSNDKSGTSPSNLEDETELECKAMVDSGMVMPSQSSSKADDSSALHPDRDPEPSDSRPTAPQLTPEDADRQQRLRAATKRLRIAYTTAKRRYRIPQVRIARIQSALDRFVGTANYHNYTVLKTFRDPSAKRHIKSFQVNPQPILIGEGPEEDKSEWLSLKVHGQSFMMHQIRKMVGMVALLVRCGSSPATLTHSLGSEKYSIPKVPGLGLLLERPVFESYNTIQATKHGRPTLEFSKFETEMEAFKQREIYQRIFREEEERNEFGRFFNHIDNFKEPYFLYVTGGGFAATQQSGGEGRERSGR